MPRARPDALSQAIALLAASDKTRAQLMEALRRRGYRPAEIDEAAQRLTALGYLDDRRVAQRKAHRDLHAGWAGLPLLARLTAAGFGEELAQQALGVAIAESRWNGEDAARKLLSRNRLVGVKAARFLARRGFDEDVVERLGLLNSEE